MIFWSISVHFRIMDLRRLANADVQGGSFWNLTFVS